MSSSDRTRGSAPPLAVGASPLRDEPSERHENAPAAGPPAAGRDPYGNWLDRMQRARARHAAITRNLHTWSNYKNWAEQVKDSWDAEKK